VVKKKDKIGPPRVGLFFLDFLAGHDDPRLPFSPVRWYRFGETGEGVMALHKCPDCGWEVSDKAKVCPGCGRPR
jgi:hypothetical protein